MSWLSDSQSEQAENPLEKMVLNKKPAEVVGGFWKMVRLFGQNAGALGVIFLRRDLIGFVAGQQLGEALFLGRRKR